MRWIFSAFVGLIAGFYSLMPHLAAAAPKSDLWDRWLRHEETSTLTVPHETWDLFLRKYAKLGEDGVTRLAYTTVTPAARQSLDSYIGHLQAIPVDRLNRAEQKAYWINLYNALTVQVILAHYPVRSILDIKISPGLFASGPWGKKLISIAGEMVSLDDIEHRILRPIWRDPRVHYAVNCASFGCPNLRTEAYRPKDLERQLDEQATAFINHSRGARVEKGKLVVSSIYAWFKSDFGNTDENIILHLKKYAEPALTKTLDKVTKIDHDEYDWSLNIQLP